MQEQWKKIDYDSRYQVSNFGNFRKKNPKNGYKYLKSYKKRNLMVVKIKDKEFNCARLVSHYHIKFLNKTDRVYHKNKIKTDNFYGNLKVISTNELGTLTGHMSKSQPVIEVLDGEIIRMWKSARKCAKDLFINRQTVCNYCNGKVNNQIYNLMWEEDYKY